MDAAQLMLDDRVEDLRERIAQLAQAVESVASAIDNLYEAEREDAHRELDFED